MRYEMRFAGTGGQGIILAGLVVAEAGCSEGFNVAHAQNYGPEVRGGTSASEVIFSDEEIDYPETLELDILLALTRRACDQNISSMKSDGLIIANADFIDAVSWAKVVRIPFTSEAKKVMKDQRFANILAIGTLSVFCPLLSTASLTKAIRKRAPASTTELNLAAFQEGVQLARKVKESFKVKEVDGMTEV